MRYLSKHNLLRWFIEDHRTLPESYKKSCQKFFDELRAASRKPELTSGKQQAITKSESEK
jgi:hypothetical protein